MKSMPSSTREKILNEGLALASQAGLEGVTLGVLARQVGMSKSGLFAHFHSKEAVQISLLEQTQALGEPIIVAPAIREPEGLPRLQAVVRNWFGWSARAGLPGGCPVAAGMFEYDDIESPVRDKILEMEAAWRGVLSGLVREAVKAGHLRRDLDIDQFVWELSGIYLAHHTALRFIRSPDADRRAETAFHLLLERSKSEKSARRRSKRRV
jgi:AcrR family transcriptional regulator